MQKGKRTSLYHVVFSMKKLFFWSTIKSLLQTEEFILPRAVFSLINSHHHLQNLVNVASNLLDEKTMDAWQDSPVVCFHLSRFSFSTFLTRYRVTSDSVLRDCISANVYECIRFNECVATQ